MNYTLPNEVKMILDKFQEAKFQIYIVGGAVRNLLMKSNVSDWDFTTDAKPEEILKIFPEGFYDNKFGTVGVSSNLGNLEITTMRKEGIYKDYRHPVNVSWTNKIEEDLARRDFSINAIALSQTSEIIDPFNGQDDIKNKIIKAVGNPTQRFKEDALRLIRAIRIATELEFEIDPKTAQAIKENAHLIKEVANERIREELFKLLESSNPFRGITKL